MFNVFINRPILSIVISIFITLLGLISLSQLPVTQYPNVEPPSVTVTTQYTGANAEVCAKAVVTPLERAINGVAGMKYMTSVSGNDGSSIITVSFKSGIDPNVAAVNVQNRVNTFLDELPEEVVKAGIIVEKEVNSMLLYINILSDDTTLKEKFLYNFADINIIKELRRIDGVGYAEIMGHREYAIRVWLDPNKLVQYKLSSEEVIQALRNQNIEAAPGKIGESSGKKAQTFQYVIKYTGKFNTPESYENIPIRSESDGLILRLKDIATIELGSEDYHVLSKENGKPSAAIVLKQRPGSNANEVIKNVKQKMEDLQETSFLPGMKYTLSYDVSRFLDASIHEVIKTLIEAFLLVAFIVFVFLQDTRATIITAISVPISIIGTFLFMNLFSFSINLLTLFALVLAIGIVVDNAIVVVEAIFSKMEQENVDSKTATLLSMKEISSAIISITLVMSAVFIPVAFLSGPIGIFYRQFSVTLAISIVISGLVALTLIPALCALYLKPHKHASSNGNFIQKIFSKFNSGYQKIENKFIRIVEKIINRTVITIGILLLFFGLTIGFGKLIPTGFIPTEDQSVFYVHISTPSGSSLERTEKITNEIEKLCNLHPDVEGISTLTGFNMLTDGYGTSYGMCMINLKPWENRKNSVSKVIDEIKAKTENIKDATLQFFPPPPIPGYGNASGFELRILDKSGKDNLKKLELVASEFAKELNKQPEMKNTFSSYDASFPQFLIKIDYDKAAQKGVDVETAMSNLQSLVGSFYATNFIKFGQLYKVMVQALPIYRALPNDILKLHVKNNEGEMVPYSSFANLEKVYGPEQLTRYNMYLSAMINGEPKEGFSSGDCIAAINKIAKEKLPKGYIYEWSGFTLDEVESSGQTIYIFIICLLFVYLLLSAQYESFILPLPVLLSLPTGIFGVFLLLMLFGLENNIYAQVAMIMLIGLLGKNAILIIEFANQKRKQGLNITAAALEAAKLRLRPIIMTSLAFIAGLIPLAMATGAGEIGNKTIGSAAIGGMLFGTVFGLLIIPGLYVLFANIEKKIKSKKVTDEII